MRPNRIVRAGSAGLVISAGLLTAAAIGAAPAQADGPLDLGQSICPMLAESGSKLSGAASGVTNATGGFHGKQGPDPMMAEFMSRMAIGQYCPEAVASLGNGQLPNVPFILNDRPPMP